VLYGCVFSTGHSNRQKAAELVTMLTEFCFEGRTARWHEVHLEEPVAAAV